MAQEPKTVELRICGQELEVRPAVPEARQLLTVRWRVVDATDGCKIGFADERFYYGPEDVRDLFVWIGIGLEHFPGQLFDFLLCSTGALESLYAQLTAAGYKVRINNYGAPPLPLGEPVLVGAGLPRSTCTAITEFVAYSTHGRLIYPAGLGPIKLVAAVARIYPSARIAVALDTVSEVEEFGTRLQARFGRQDVTWATSVETCASNTGSLHVTTFRGLAAYACEPESRAIVLVPNALCLLSKRNRRELLWAARARIYGFLPARQQLASRDERALSCVLGPHVVGIPRAANVPVRPQVYWVRIDGGRHGARPGATRPAHSPALWADSRRGRIIARLAAAVAERDTDALKRYPGLTGLLPTSCQPRVLVLVDGVQQLATLAKELQRWPLMYAADAHLGFLTEVQQADLAASRVADASQETTVICTTAALSTVRLARFDVIVRADGGVGIPAPLHSVSPRGMIQPRIVLIDLWDRDPALRARARARRDAYVRAGWESTRASISNATGATL